MSVQVKYISPPYKGSPTLANILVFAPALVGFLMLSEDKPTAISVMIGGPIVMTPFAYIICWIRGVNALASYRVTSKRAFEVFCGKDTTHVDVNVVADKGSFHPYGIACDSRKIYLMDAGYAASFHINDVRKWSWSIEGYQQVSAFGIDFATSMEVQSANARARREADRRSGLTVELRSIENPTWFFSCADRRVLERWHEILLQARETPKEEDRKLVA